MKTRGDTGHGTKRVALTDMSMQTGEHEARAIERLLPGRAYRRRFERAIPLLEADRAARDVAGDAIPESAAPPAVRARDAIYRRSLATSDALVASVALLLAVSTLGDDRLTATSLVVIPLIVLVGKVTGLYDRDQHLIRRTTLDELPTLFEVATLYTLVAWFAESLYVHGALAKTQVFALWILVFLGMAVGRELVRQAVKRRTKPERCILLGDAEAGARIAQKFSMSYSIRAELLGRVPFKGEAAGARRGGPPVLGAMASLPLCWSSTTWTA